MKAYCFDLDGTLTTTEILPCIAAELGVSEELATLTRITMEGLITFEESLRLRCVILGQVPCERVHAIIEDIPLDTRLLDFIQLHRDDCFVITGNLDVWIEPMIQRIGCRSFASSAINGHGRVILKHVLDKGSAISAIRRMGYTQIVATGDGSNDIPMLRAADAGIAYGGVHSPTSAAIGAADYVIHNGSTLCNLLSAL
jgi:HAD superfamily phosphoserine phosphatase-like hydrolase